MVSNLTEKEFDHDSKLILESLVESPPEADQRWTPLANGVKIIAARDAVMVGYSPGAEDCARLPWGEGRRESSVAHHLGARELAPDVRTADRSGSF